MYEQIQNFPTREINLNLPEEVFDTFFELLSGYTYDSTEVLTSIYTIDNETVEEELEIDEDSISHQLLVDMSIARDEDFIGEIYSDIEILNKDFEGINLSLKLEDIDYINVFKITE